MYDALANLVKNATGGVLKKIVKKNPDLRLGLYSLRLYWKLALTQAFFRDKKQLPCSSHLQAFLISALHNRKFPRLKLLISMYVRTYLFHLLSIILKIYKL